MDEATALLTTLMDRPADAPTACAGWTAHELTAHLAAGAAEMADLVEAEVAGRPARPTAAFAEREAPFRDLADGALRERLVAEALRLDAAVADLRRAGEGRTVAFSGRRLTPDDLALHGRSEAALHRWDLAGSDGTSRELLAAPELTAHALAVLADMVAGSPDSPGVRAAAAGVADLDARLGSPGRPDVVVTCREGRVDLRLTAPDGAHPPSAVLDPDVRLLALWGRGPARHQLPPGPLPDLLFGRAAAGGAGA